MGNYKHCVRMGFFALIVLIVSVSWGEAQNIRKQWKNYVKGPGVTYVNGDSGFNLEVICPEYDIPVSGEDVSTSIQIRFTIPFGSMGASHATYTYSIIGPKPGSPDETTVLLTNTESEDFSSTQSKTFTPLIEFVDTNLSHFNVNQRQVYSVQVDMELDYDGMPVQRTGSISVIKVSAASNMKPLVLNSVKKNVSRYNQSGTYYNVYTLFNELDTLPLLLTEPFDAFLLNIGPGTAFPGIPDPPDDGGTPIYPVLYWAILDSADNTVFSGQKPFDSLIHNTLEPSYYIGTQDILIELNEEETPHYSWVPGTYCLHLWSTDGAGGSYVDGSGATYLFEKRWNFSVEDHYCPVKSRIISVG